MMNERMGDLREGDLLELAWGVIANANKGNWSGESPTWQDAARRWRDSYHAWLDTNKPAEPTCTPATDPVGAVRVHPDDDPDSPEARRVFKHIEIPWWCAFTGFPSQQELRAHHVADWTPQHLADVARVLGHEDRLGEARDSAKAFARQRDEHKAQLAEFVSASLSAQDYVTRPGIEGVPDYATDDDERAAALANIHEMNRLLPLRTERLCEAKDDRTQLRQRITALDRQLEDLAARNERQAEDVRNKDARIVELRQRAEDAEIEASGHRARAEQAERDDWKRTAEQRRDVIDELHKQVKDADNADGAQVLYTQCIECGAETTR